MMMKIQGWRVCMTGIVAAVFMGILAGCGSETRWKQTPGGQEASKQLALERQQSDGTGGEDSRLNVVTTLFPYYDFTRQIAGNRVDLTLVIPAGMDSHSFEPTPADMRMIQNADILIRNGGEMERWLDEVLAALDTSNMTIVTMMDYVDAVEEELVEGMEDAGHSHGGEDHDHGSEDHTHETADHGHGSEDHTHKTADHDHGSQDHTHKKANHDHGSEGHAYQTADQDHGSEDHAHQTVDQDHAHETADQDHAHETADQDHGSEDHTHKTEDQNHAHETADHDHGSQDHTHQTADQDHGPVDHAHAAAEHKHEAESHDLSSRPDMQKDYIDYDGHEAVIEYDEHIWTSPVNAMKLVKAIRDILEEKDVPNAAGYHQQTETYLAKLESIDAGFREVSQARKRNMIVVGDKFPFRYLADEYRFDYRAAFSGCSSDTEPSAKTIAYLIDKVKEEQIPVVYYLELSSHRVAEIIGEETGAVPMLLHSGHNVTRTQFDSGITYVELMEQNVENLRKGIDE